MNTKLLLAAIIGTGALTSGQQATGATAIVYYAVAAFFLAMVAWSIFCMWRRRRNGHGK